MASWRRKGAGRLPRDLPSRSSVERSGSQAPEIRASRFSFHPSASAEAPILRDLSFQVDPGSILLVSGATGAGKSTLLRLIAGLAGTYPEPHAAGVLEVRRPDDPVETGAGPSLPEPRPGQVVLVPQSPRDALVSLDVFSALALPLEEQGRPAGETRRRVEDGLDHMGLLSKADQDVARLSTGEARRVALACALVQDAGLLLLDEPLADLDPSGVKTLRQDLRSLPGRRTVVVAEHRHRLMSGLVDKTVHLLGREEQRAFVRSWPLDQGPEGPVQGPASIRTQNLHLSRGGNVLLDGVHLELGPGVWGLLGPNGTGKTTLLETLAGLIPPDAGRVETAGVHVWDGANRVRPRRRNERTLRRSVQVAFQEPREAFFASTVRQELKAPLVAGNLTPKQAEKSVVNALEAMGRADLLERDPPRLSGGEARFVQLLGVVLGKPQVLLLDEPTHGLDAGLRDDLVRLIDALGRSGRLVIVATHEPGILPTGAKWLFLPGDGQVLQGPDAAPGAPVPVRAGFDRELLETTASREVAWAEGLESGVHV